MRENLRHTATGLVTAQAGRFHAGDIRFQVSLRSQEVGRHSAPDERPGSAGEGNTARQC